MIGNRTRNVFAAGHLLVRDAFRDQEISTIHHMTLGLRNPSGPQYACNLFLLNASSYRAFRSPVVSLHDRHLTSRSLLVHKVSPSKLHLTEPLCRLSTSPSPHLSSSYVSHSSASLLPHLHFSLPSFLHPMLRYHPPPVQHCAPPKVSHKHGTSVNHDDLTGRRRCAAVAPGCGPRTAPEYYGPGSGQ